jgi:hypothetical protein
VSSRLKKLGAAAGASVGPHTGGLVQRRLLRDSTSDIYDRAGRPAHLRGAACYGGFAVAGTVPDGKSQPSRLVFAFDAATNTWRPLNVGSGGICDGFVPDAAAKHLPGC